MVKKLQQPAQQEEVNLNQPTEILELPQAEEVNLASNQEEILPQAEEITETTTSGDSSDDPFYTEEEFYNAFKSMFQFGADTLNCQSLAISAEEELGARTTANRIYAEAKRYKFLEFIIRRDNGKVAEAILIITFIINKINAVAKEKKINNVWGKLWSRTSKLFRIFSKKTGKGSVSSAPVVAEKQAKPEDYLKPADA